jgi:diguanylate cyclase (GGDEF)-like protein
MKIRTKLILIQMALLVFLSLGVLLTLYCFVLPGIESIERQSAQTDLDRAHNALNAEQERLWILARDWSVWDDAYDYIEARNPEFVESNFEGDTLGGLHMDYMLITRMDGSAVLNLFADDAGTTEASQLITQQLSFQTLEEVAAQKYALVQTDRGLMALVGHAVYPSDESGSPNGYLFFGRFLNQEVIYDMSEKLRLPLVLKTVPNTGQSGSVIRFVNEHEIDITETLPILNAKDKLAEINIHRIRPFYQQSLEGAIYAVAGIMVGGLLVSWVIFYLLKRLLVSPILALQEQAEHFNHSGRGEAFNPLQRDDEIGQLSKSFVTMAKRLNEHWLMLSRERNDYLNASHTDPLTGLKNRRYLEEQLTERTLTPGQSQWMFMMLDIDHFKRLNDEHGHDVGDVVLQQFAELISELSRAEDKVIRYGGEEFVIACRDMDEQSASSFAERIRTRTEQHIFGIEGSPLSITCSMGFFVASINPAEEELHWRAMLKVADLALYAAKHSGRNTWVGLKLSPCNEHHPLPEKPEEIRALLRNQCMALYSGVSPASNIVW